MLDLSGATPRQREFINDLLTSREYVLPENLTILTPTEASHLIERMLAAPRKRVAAYVKPARIEDSELDAALLSAPISRYAIPRNELFPELLNLRLYDNDMLFLEVKKFRGRIVLVRLTGSVGYFSRSLLSRSDTLILMGVLSRNPVEYARAFGVHYRCCGRCGAELTDEESRRTQFGPICRKVFHL